MPAHCSLLTAHYSLPTSHCLLLTAHCFLLTAYCVLHLVSICSPRVFVVVYNRADERCEDLPRSWRCCVGVCRRGAFREYVVRRRASRLYLGDTRCNSKLREEEVNRKHHVGGMDRTVVRVVTVFSLHAGEKCAKRRTADQLVG